MSETKGSTIVVGVDDTEVSFLALDRAVKIAAAFEAEIVVVFIRTLPPIMGDEPADVVEVYEESVDDAQSDTKKRAGAVCDAANIAWRMVVRDGDAAVQLIETADEVNASLIVVGAHKHGAISSVVTASIASYLVHHSDVSFVVVRPEADTDKANNELPPKADAVIAN